VTRAITVDPETMHGVPVFRGTRVPAQTLFEYLEGGDTLENFLLGFPTVPRADSEGWRSAFRTDVDHDSELMSITIPK
jgi:uncharacterized protein (DUF433 family)